MLDYLQRIGKPTWIRHVVVPGKTDSVESLTAVANHVAKYSVVERVELLPYHTMGAYKYEKLGLPNPLEGVPALDAEKIKAARKLVGDIVSCCVL